MSDFNGNIAVIDVGSNSVKMRIGRLGSEGKLLIVRDETEVTKLGRFVLSDIQGKNFKRENFVKTIDAIKKMLSQARHASEIILVGTMALRAADNSEEFLNAVRDETGYNIRILSGQEEAEYSWLGAIHDISKSEDDNIVMFDSGGGSTEFVFGRGSKIEKVTSVSIGAVNITEKFFSKHHEIIKRRNIDQALEYIAEKLHEYGIQNLCENRETVKIIGVGGGVVAMAGVKSANEIFMPSNLHGMRITQRDVRRQIELYSSLTLRERQNIIGLPPNRADVILGSACIVHEILKNFALSRHECFCTVSINGLRNGILIERFLQR